MTGVMMKGARGMFDREGRGEGCGGGEGTWRRLAGRPARIELDRRLAFLETADLQERSWTTVEETSRYAWRRAIRKWRDLGGSTMGAGRRLEAMQRAGRRKEREEWRVQQGGARSFVRNGVWRVEGERAQQRREQSAKRGRARSEWLRQRREAVVERQRGALECEARYKAQRLARLEAAAADRGTPTRWEVATCESLMERDMAMQRQRRDGAVWARWEHRRLTRWSEALPAECVGSGSCRARGMVKRARAGEGWEERGGAGEGGRKRAKGLGHAGVVAARIEVTLSCL